MADFNYIKLVFYAGTISVAVGGYLLNFFEKYLPLVMREACRYGKFALKTKEDKSIPEVPKSWFKHFYIWAITFSTILLLCMINALVFGHSPPQWCLSILDYSLGTNRKASVSASASLLAMILFNAHSWRRCYETHFISVFGKNSRMNIGIYLIALLHYTGAILAIIGEAPKFAKSSKQGEQLSFLDLGFTSILATALFCWSSLHQHRIMLMLANLRKNEKGVVVTDSHKLPRGGWFEYVSSPQNFMEILIYISLYLILWNNSTWRSVVIWTITNQVETALLSHQWYQETFSDLPKHRKAVIPLIC